MPIVLKLTNSPTAIITPRRNRFDSRVWNSFIDSNHSARIRRVVGGSTQVPAHA